MDLNLNDFYVNLISGINSHVLGVTDRLNGATRDRI